MPVTREIEVTREVERPVPVTREVEVTRVLERRVPVTREVEVTRVLERRVPVTREVEVTRVHIATPTLVPTPLEWRGIGDKVITDCVLPSGRYTVTAWKSTGTGYVAKVYDSDNGREWYENGDEVTQVGHGSWGNHLAPGKCVIEPLTDGEWTLTFRRND